MSKDLTIARDTEKGWILEDGNRLVTFKVKTFQAFVDRLGSLVGSRVSEVIMYQLGTEVGHVAYKYSEKEVRLKAQPRKNVPPPTAKLAFLKWLSRDHPDDQSLVVHVPGSIQRQPTQTLFLLWIEKSSTQLILFQVAQLMLP